MTRKRNVAVLAGVMSFGLGVMCVGGERPAVGWREGLSGGTASWAVGVALASGPASGRSSPEGWRADLPMDAGVGEGASAGVGMGVGKEVEIGVWAGKIHPALDRLLAERGEVVAWVFFADKGIVSSGDLAARLEALALEAEPRQVQRRAARRTAAGLFDEHDLPVRADYLSAVEAAVDGAGGGRVRQVSRWLNAVSVRTDRAGASRLASLPFVTGLQPIRWGIKPGPTRPGDAGISYHDEIRGAKGAGGAVASWGAGGDGFYGRAEAQLAEITLPPMHAAGFTGKGVIVGVLDTGFERGHEAFSVPGREVKVVAEYDFVEKDPITSFQPGDDPDQPWHGTAILGVLGASKPGSLVGGAYEAGFILCKTEDIRSETPVEEDHYVAGLEFIELKGGDMATASLIYIDWYTQSQLTGLIATTTKAVNIATANGVHCLNAAGNFGHDGDPATSALGAPADALRVISCGAAHGDGSIAGFSSDGPTADGRVKPEVLARGVDSQTVDPGSTGGYIGVNGTSLSTPTVACAVACLIQARPGYTVDQMRTMLFETAKDYVRTGTTDPLFIRGYGFIDANLAWTGDCNGNGVPDGRDLSSGTSRDCDGDRTPDECGCRPDMNKDGRLDVRDFAEFQNLFALAKACADYNGDGAFDVRDFTAFQNGFALGCP